MSVRSDDCRRRADEAEQKAQKTSDASARASYEGIARLWRAQWLSRPNDLGSRRRVLIPLAMSRPSARRHPRHRGRFGRGGVTAMPTYRVYILVEGHIRSEPKLLSASDDMDAITQAKAMVDGHDVEVWDGQRLVTALPSTKEAKQ